MRLKKTCILFMIFIFLFQNFVFADDELEENIIWSENDEIIQNEKQDDISEPKLLSRHCICVERTTEQVLLEKDAYTKCPMASTTKILTGIIIIENCNLQDEVTISKKASNTGGSTLGITEGQKITVETLLYGLLLRSGNDTAVALAEYYSGSVEEFAKVMNQKAKEIGVQNSNFVTPHGLDSDEHYTTAYDLAIITNYALNNDGFRKIVGTKQINVNMGNYNRVLNNTNELLGNVNGVYGVKTGFTGNAGRCLVTACKREDMDIIIVVLGADTKNIRGSDTKKIIDYIFKNYKMVDTEKEIEEFFYNYKNSEKIKGAKTLSKIEIDYKKRKNYNCPIDKRKISKLKTTIYCFNKLEAPLKNNSTIGKIRLICDDKILYEIDICLKKKIDRIDWKEYLSIFVQNYITFYSI